MSFEQLMQHARDIQQKAIEKSLEQHGVRRAPRPGQPALSPMPLEAEKRQQIEQSFSDIPGLFRPFSEMPIPASFDGMIDDLSHALRMLSAGQDPKDPINGTIYTSNTNLDKLSGSESYVEHWTGRAAMEFKSNFIDPFPSVVRNQFIIAAVLKSALEAQREIWVKARNDIDKIAHDALEALDRMDDCGKNEWTMTFTVVASVAAIAAVPLTGGASLTVAALAVTAVGAASQVAAAAAPDDPPKIQFSGETAEAVVSQLREAMSKLVELIGGQEAKISYALTNTHSLVTGGREGFVSKRPALAAATARDVRGPEYMGYST